MKTIGIYQIVNKINAKKYIGSSINVFARKRQHFHQLRANKHCNPILQAAWSKYGEEAFQFDCLEICSIDSLLDKEQFWIDTIKPEYNVLIIAGSPKGTIRTAETRAKMSKARKGMVLSAITRQRISESLKGRKVPREIVERRARTQTGRKKKPHSIETRMLLSKTLKGRKGIPRSEQTRAKMSARATGRMHSEETKKKISINRSGIYLGKRTTAICDAIARAKAVLTEAQIRQIRTEIAAGLKHRAAGIKFGISKTTAGQIARRESYSWVT